MVVYKPILIYGGLWSQIQNDLDREHTIDVDEEDYEFLNNDE